LNGGLLLILRQAHGSPLINSVILPVPVLLTCNPPPFFLKKKYKETTNHQAKITKKIQKPNF